MIHKKHQEANDWVTCTCGKVFSETNGTDNTKYSKLKEHMEKENDSLNLKSRNGCKKELNIPGDENNIKCGEGILCSDCSPNLKESSK